MDANQNSNKKLSKVLSTKLSIDDYNAFLILTKLEYQAVLIKEEGTSESVRFTIRHILNQLRNNLIYPILEEENSKEAEQFQNMSSFHALRRKFESIHINSFSLKVIE